ncbi:MAG: hypothetical protein JWN04_1590 [Myxococcaceae bacterium]|nr:hypothetical protein [Myxococcaceae bacterium]
MTSSKPHTETPEFDRLADEIVRGERVLLFAPGIWSFLVANMMTMFGFMALLVIGVPRLLDITSRSQKTVVELVCAQLAVFLSIIPSLLVMRGSTIGPKIWRGIIDVGVLAAVAALCVTWRRPLGKESIAFMVASGMLGVAFLVLRTVGFAMLAIFRQRIRVQRAAFLAELSQGLEKQPHRKRPRRR